MLQTGRYKSSDVFGPLTPSGKCAKQPWQPIQWTAKRPEKRQPHQENNTRDAKDQAWRRNPSGKPTNEERARKTGLFQYQDCWSKDRDSWPFLSTPPSPPLPPPLTPPPPPLCTEPWVASKLTPGPGKEEGGRGGEGGEVSPGQQQRVSW